MLEDEVELLASRAILWDKVVFIRGAIPAAKEGLRIDISAEIRNTQAREVRMTYFTVCFTSCPLNIHSGSSVIGAGTISKSHEFLSPTQHPSRFIFFALYI